MERGRGRGRGGGGGGGGGGGAAYALVIIPPPELWAPFVAIKRHHMNPKIKRPPYPHITLLGKYSGSARDSQRVGDALRDCDPFNVTIERWRVFDNPTQCTVYLEPEEDDQHAGAMRGLHERLRQSGFATREFDAHIGVAFCKSRREADALVARYQPEWVPMRFAVTHIYVMKRCSETDPFEPVEAIALRDCQDVPLQHELVAK